MPKPPRKYAHEHENGWEPNDCNKRIAQETALELDIPTSQVIDAVSHFNEFIALTIASGSLEGIQVPYLGKFQVKLAAYQFQCFVHSLHPDMKALFKNRTSREMYNLFYLQQLPVPQSVDPNDIPPVPIQNDPSVL